MGRCPVLLGVAVFSATALTLGSELALRAVGFSSPAWHRPDPQLGWTLRPGVRGWFVEEGATIHGGRSFVRVNSSGMRDREHARAKPEGVYRIAVLGDAYSEAMPVELDKAYWALLGPKLERCGFQPGKRIEMLNFGVTGYGTAQAYVMLETKALGYRPDLVLLQFAHGNDVRDNSFALDSIKQRPFLKLEADGGARLDYSFASSPEFRRRASPVYQAIKDLADYSRLIQLARDVKGVALLASAHAAGSHLSLEPDVLDEPRGLPWQEAWRVTEGLLARIAELVHANGARVAVFTVPYALQAHPDAELRASMQAKYRVSDFAYPERRVAAIAERNGMRAILLAQELQAAAAASGTYLYGFDNTGIGSGHWNERGHRAAAGIIARQLCVRGA